MALALDLWNEIELNESANSTFVTIEGNGEQNLSTDGSNLIAKCSAFVY
jgi:homoserine kinase